MVKNMRKFVVNEKEYVAKPFDFNLVCDLEDYGFSMEEMGSKKIKAVRAYFAICAGLTVEQAGKEIEQHVISGKDISDITVAMNEEMEKSDFFRALFKATETETAANQKKADEA